MAARKTSTILTPAQRKEMKSLNHGGHMTRAALGKKFNCSLSTVTNVIGETKGKTRGHGNLLARTGLVEGFVKDGFWYQKMGRVTKI